MTGRDAEREQFAPATRLVDRYCAGEMSADDYYSAMDVLAKRAIADELADMTRRRQPRAEEAS